MLIILAMTAFRLWILCDSGSDIEENSSLYLHDIYDVDWPNADETYKKNFLIMAENFRRPISVQMCGFITIDMVVFQTIMETAYKVIALLQRMNWSRTLQSKQGGLESSLN